MMCHTLEILPLNAAVVSSHAKYSHGSLHHWSQKSMVVLNKGTDLTHLHCSPLTQSGASQTQEPFRHAPNTLHHQHPATLFPEAACVAPYCLMTMEGESGNLGTC